MAIRAVIWDFGGVLSSSPFEAFARYEQEHGLPEGFIRQINATDPDTNAWARFERNEVDVEGFAELFEAEATAAGHSVDGMAVLGLLGGEIRPRMIEAVRRCGEKLATGLLTNNYTPFGSTRSTQAKALETDKGRGFDQSRVAEILDLFDVVVESSRVGVRKPDPEIYRMICERLEIEPYDAVFLDDLGVNLKPARAMGMTTIKVVDPDEALKELEQAVGFPVS